MGTFAKFLSPHAFQPACHPLRRIEQVWEWLPEWTALRQLISETDFSSD
ncbi:MAG: hypothetical protein AAGA60_31070 [Cyanobacteria bacterium P01_E01_bin.42]